MQAVYLQLQIWRWQVKNYKRIYIFLAAMFLVVLPVIGAVFRLGSKADDYELVYNYVIYMTTTLLSALGGVPLLLLLHGIYHSPSGDCVILCPGWSEHKQYVIHYLISTAVIVVMMLLLMLIFLPGIRTGVFLRDAADLLVILWVLYSVSHILVKITGNVYLALIAVELYMVLFWLMGIGLGTVWNLYDISSVDGVVWLFRVIMYVAFGIMLEEFSRLTIFCFL